MNYLYIFAAIFFTNYGQIILKWRLNQLGSLPETLFGRISFLGSGLLDIYIISGFVSAFVASIFWMAAMTKFKITVAYLFMSLSPALVFLVGEFFLGKRLPGEKYLV